MIGNQVTMPLCKIIVILMLIRRLLYDPTFIVERQQTIGSRQRWETKINTMFVMDRHIHFNKQRIRFSFTKVGQNDN